MIVVISITLLITYKYKYVKRFGLYSFSYYSQALVLILVSVYLIFEKYLRFNQNYIILSSIAIQLLILFPIGLYPSIRYRKGLYFFIPTIFRVPISGRDLELSLENKTPFESAFKIELILPSNVILKDGSNKYIKEGVIKPKGKINLKILVRSVQNKNSKKTKATLYSDINGVEDYYLDVIT